MDNITKSLRFPKQSSALISQLEFTDVNREVDLSHIQTMTHKIKENGFLDVIKVFPLNNKGKFIVAESQHRVEAIRNIIGEDTDIEVPVAILDWLDPNDREEVISTITALNVGSRSWNIFDYVRTNSLAKRPNSSDYDYILKKLSLHRSQISNNQICQIYNGGNIPDDKFRNGKDWVLTHTNKKYGDIVLNEIVELLNINGKRGLNAMVLRYFIIECFKYQRQLLKNNTPVSSIKDFLRFLEVTSSEFTLDLSKGKPLPEGGDPMKAYIKNRIFNQL